MTIKEQITNVDAVVIGAGFSGMYMLYRLREAGFSVQGYEAAAGVGGVWYANRYPGARCDSESIIYNYTFNDEILQEWTWTTRFPAQEEILNYLNFAADKLDIRRNIEFNTRVVSAHFNDKSKEWDITLDSGKKITSKYFITGVGCLSASNIPNFKGLNSFKGEAYHTGRWPHEKVDFTNKRVGLIGTGSSGVQSIPVIAEEAGHLNVFQRTPAYSTPARNYVYDEEFIRKTKENYEEIKQKTRWSSMGYLHTTVNHRSALDDTPEEREQEYEKIWERGGLGFSQTYKDLLVNEEANETASEFIRSKIDNVVEDPEVAKKLKPTYFYSAKRPVIDTNYYETFNRDNVTLVDVKAAPIVEITPQGIKTTEAEYELDMIVFATGYDAMTGPLFKIDIRGKDGVSLKEKWADGTATRTYLGLANAGFPNMFMITGPESPSVLSNVPVSIEQHVEWIGDCIEHLRENNIETIEATVEAENEWSKNCFEIAQTTLLTKVESWYTGANIDDKPRCFPIYTGGVGNYRKICDEVTAKGYEGFTLTPANAKETIG